ncbi:MAG: GNAT family N-acetyltransferase [Eubacteriales bacterium]|nr:GNAT family N-acetyltransferase [Eubacteriales bacterium]
MSNPTILKVEGAEALERVAPLFQSCEETMVWTALEGNLGQIWICPSADGKPPKAAICKTLDFVFIAGDGEGAEASRLLQGFKALLNDAYAILTPQNESWKQTIQAIFPDAIPKQRYAIQKNGDNFDRAWLAELAKKLPPDVALHFIDGAFYDLAKAEGWSKDLCFGTKQDFLSHGLGVVAVQNGELVGGASSFIYYSKGIEIEVDTRKDKRRQGIAAACCAKLILACLEKGLYPSWDAANRESVQLALKLGYQEKGPYWVYETKEEA